MLASSTGKGSKLSSNRRIVTVRPRSQTVVNSLSLRSRDSGRAALPLTHPRLVVLVLSRSSRVGTTKLSVARSSWLLAIGLALSAPRALAVDDSLEVKLVYVRAGDASDCADEEELRDAVKARLGFDPFSKSAPTTIEVHVERKAEQLTSLVRIMSDGPPLERSLTSSGKDCTELSQAIALAVALAIDPLSTAPKAAPAPTPVPGLPAVVMVAPTPPNEEKPVEVQGLLQASLLGAVGSEPGPTAGLAFGGGLRLAKFSAWLEARADLPGSLAVDTGRVRANLLAASLLPCLHLGVFRGCVLMQAGVLRAEGDQLIDAKQLVFPHLALGARLGAEWPSTGRWAVVGQLDLAAPLIRTSLKVNDRTAWSSAPLSASLGLGGLVRF